ncbi:unnamed protein product, partial [Closterium sp. NIES-65]
MSLAVIVVSLLLLRGASQPSVMAQMPDVMPRGQIGGEAGIERAMSLFRVSSRSLARSRVRVRCGQSTADACGAVGPVVRRSDADNLPLTRVAQRDLWEHQLLPPPPPNLSLPTALPTSPRACLPPNQPGARIGCRQSTADAGGAEGSVGAPAVPRQLRRQAPARRAVAHQDPPRRGVT